MPENILAVFDLAHCSSSGRVVSRAREWYRTAKVLCALKQALSIVR